MNNRRPMVSVVIVNWNVGELLLNCLDSLFSESYGFEVEVIVVDNASKDGSIELVQSRYSDVRILKLTKNIGFARANNLAISQSQGRYLLLLNPDTVLLPDTVQALVRFLNNYSDAGVAGCKQVYADGQYQSTCHRMITLEREAIVALGLTRLFPQHVDYGDLPLTKAVPFRVDWVGGACLIVRRTVLEQVGLLDENLFMYAEDADLCHRVRRAGYSVYYLPSVRVIHYRGQSTAKLSESGTSVSAFKLGLHYWAKQYVIRKHSGELKARLYYGVVATELIRKLLQTTVKGVVPVSGSERRVAAAEREANLAVLKTLIGGRL